MSGWIGAWGTTATVTNLTVTGSEVISVNTSTDALRITQTGSGNALVVEDSANPDSSPFVIDTNGRAVIGNTAPRSIGGDLFPFTIDGIDYAGSSPAFVCNSNNGNPVLLQLAKSRGTTPGSVTSVASGDTLGRVDFRGADGTGLIQAATISAAVDGTPGTNDMPGRLVFSTTADGASSPTERMRIDSQGSVIVTNSSSTSAVRITQTGTGNALVVEDSANPDSTPFLIDNSGRIIQGHTGQVAGAVYNPTNQIFSNTWDCGFGFFEYSNDVASSILQFNKTRATTPNGHAVVAANDRFGVLQFAGSDGTSYVRGAEIIAFVDGTPGTNDMPGRLVFNTTPDGASVPTTKMTVDNGGNIYPTSGTTSMTNGFFYIPAAAGAPSGVPTAISGRVPMYYDSTNNNFYVYNGAWKKVLLA